MKNVVIKVENLSKQYRLGNVGLGTLNHDINRWWSIVRGKDDPYLKIGEENDRSSKGISEYVWALRDINFDVMQGEVLGIIGRNGAGKSTLLKILSRTTTPTTGQVKIKGRVASLLEVGTGFHPELTGRENIFLNGAILGMSKKEIKNKFDEIVDFAGVERYIDTPVKRYSSGMYVRLAFGVAAHLDPEILIVDEVLAVGDAEFQKKALGKMKDVSNREGRTVLFVSHNMIAMNMLCNKIIYLKNGMIESSGDTKATIDQYLSEDAVSKWLVKWDDPKEAPGTNDIKILEANILNDSISGVITLKESINICLKYKVFKEITFNINFILRLISGEVIFEAPTYYEDFKEGIYTSHFIIPGNLLNTNFYSVQLNFSHRGPKLIFFVENILKFRIVNDSNIDSTYFGNYEGIIKPLIKSDFKKIG
jgi:lipopolysaccharide transport system ATP-binding protein